MIPFGRIFTKSVVEEVSRTFGREVKPPEDGLRKSALCGRPSAYLVPEAARAGGSGQDVGFARVPGSIFCRKLTQSSYEIRRSRYYDLSVVEPERFDFPSQGIPAFLSASPRSKKDVPSDRCAAPAAPDKVSRYRDGVTNSARRSGGVHERGLFDRGTDSRRRGKVDYHR